MNRSKRARELRLQLTECKRLLWAQLRNRRPGGFKFRRQYPIGSFVVDFVCIERKLVVEVDGEGHDLGYERDVRRDARLEEDGYRVVRVRNDEVRGNLEEIVAWICQLVLESTPHPVPLPALRLSCAHILLPGR